MWNVVVTCLSLACSMLPEIKGDFDSLERCTAAIEHVAKMLPPMRRDEAFSMRCVRQIDL